MAEDEQQAYKRWNKRPESTVAQNFAADLDAMFGLSPEMEALTSAVVAKQQTVSTSNIELQQLEARLRETEQRLARVSRTNSPSRPDEAANASAANANANANANLSASSRPQQSKLSPLSQRPAFPADRPVTADRPRTGRADTRTVMTGMPGAMPDAAAQFGHPNDYVVVDRAGQAQPGYG